MDMLEKIVRLRYPVRLGQEATLVSMAVQQKVQLVLVVVIALWGLQEKHVKLHYPAHRGQVEKSVKIVGHPWAEQAIANASVQLVMVVQTVKHHCPA